MRSLRRISCQLSLYPLAQADYTSPVGQVLELIKTSGLAYETNDMATIVRGEPQVVFALLASIDDLMARTSTSYSLNATISNTCGCRVEQ
ncbi:YKOF domain-containing protein [Bifidobacterium actinocoloniiforme DSM 22766]|uniref:YKOF domain-containing protein n=1 Tax=Bifidobacterium actinocoloniiforme DSM 22766 TaxID=1437605 RepID=A0A086YYF8_9BIFI|nr:YkoF family thiamine/hydroxymethylpyrimidine-binding protein [Bifidobacterium actinocoloniiforme]AKV55858.1 hypothetical protein AB656_06525 [Bifidobacterium actinocoloniiforme DSM 22766]KFI39308.1 YKOF domain-containing protein [Bifidobacterium actinocoloniiforme DSM 22766]